MTQPAVKRVNTFGVHTDLTETREFSSLVSSLAGVQKQTVLFCNVHMLMLSQEDPVLASAMNGADLVFADGAPVAWLQRRITARDAQVIRGYEIMLAVCERAARKGEKVGLLGSTENVMEGLAHNLGKQFAGLIIAYQYCPPFMQGELSSTPAELAALNASGVEWLFVGLGCPKQEKWIARYRNDLDCNIFGVGAAFDWLSGQVRKPPEWMERHALIWLYRLLSDPARTWYRYLKYNLKFVFRMLGVWLSGKAQ